MQTNVKLELWETSARRENQCSEIQSSMISLLPQIREILWKRDAQFKIWGMAPVSINWWIKYVRLFAIPWIIGSQAPLSIQFFRQEYWSVLPFSSPGDLPDPWIEPKFPELTDSLMLSHQKSIHLVEYYSIVWRNKKVLHTTTWMNFTLSERGQS